MTDKALDVIASSDLYAFAQKAFEILNQAETLDNNWHLQAITHVLDDLAEGRRRRQIINMPPRTLKSQLCSVIWPAFLLGQNPAAKIIAVSYADALAEVLSIQCRTLMQSAFYRAVFPHTQLDKQANLHLTTTSGGVRFATTVGGSLTGLGGDVIVVDDPIKASDAYSQVARDGAYNFVQQTLLSRLNHPAEGKILLVMQRLHEADPSGRLLNAGGWNHLKLQARAMEDHDVPLGFGRNHHVAEGDLLMPARLSAAVLEQQRKAMGTIAYAAQYQQEPAPADGAMIKRDWLRYGSAPLRTEGNLTLSLDTAVKDNPSNDYSVCTIWLETNNGHHLIDVWREKVDFPSLLHGIDLLVTRHSPDNFLIEDAGSGSSLLQVLRAKGVPVVACKARDSKIVRLSAVSQYLESGLVWLPKDAPWLAAFEAELLGFPGARYDDQVDSLSQYLAWVRGRPVSCFICDWGDAVVAPIAHDILAERLASHR